MHLAHLCAQSFRGQYPTMYLCCQPIKCTAQVGGTGTAPSQSHQNKTQIHSTVGGNRDSPFTVPSKQIHSTGGGNRDSPFTVPSRQDINTQHRWGEQRQPLYSPLKTKTQIHSTGGGNRDSPFPVPSKQDTNTQQSLI